MKINKIILPVMIVAVVLVIYITYFNPKDDLGLFSDFDKNSNVNRDIIVKVIHDKGFFIDQASGGTVFYVEDRAGIQMKVLGPIKLPPGMDVTNNVTLRGHLHDGYFHAAEVRTRN